MLLLPFWMRGTANVTLANPTLLDTTTAATDANGITSGSISPTAGATLLTIHASRHTSSRTHSAPTTSGLTMAASWVEVAAFSVLDTDQTAYVHGSIWWAKFVSGTGTISQTASGNTFHRALSIMQVIGANATPIRQFKVASHETGTSLAATLDASTLASSLGISMLGARVSDASITDPSSYTELLDTTVSAGTLQMCIHYKLGSPSQTVTYSTLLSGEARGLINAEIAD